MSKVSLLYWKLRMALLNLRTEEDGLETIEIVIILGILVALAILFGGKLMDLFNQWWGQIATP